MKNIWDFFSLKKIRNKIKRKKRNKTKIVIKDGIKYRIIKVRKKISKKEKEIERQKYLENKENARKIVLEKLKFWQDFYKNININLEYKKVFIKNTSTRWGSCSSKKNLNFSYKIIFLSSDLQDYLIVHELCHLIEMNHGENFWKLVSLGIENYSEKRNVLRKWKMQEK